IQTLEKQVQILTNLVHAQSNIVSKFSCSKGSSGSNTASECISKVADQAKKIAKLEKDLNSLQTTVSAHVSDQWPSGSYCILASGNCPAGFSLCSGYMKAISLYAGSAYYMKQATFGDSKIQCHGRCGQYGHWTGELYINACCK
ncbi:Hypothetical predicted protein, partial [Paramuricea clavata]